MTDLIIKSLGLEGFNHAIKPYKKDFFPGAHQVYGIEKETANIDEQKIKKLKEGLGKPLAINLVLYSGMELIGWSQGVQINLTMFNMTNSAIRLEFQRQGHYTRLLDEMIVQASNLGFEEIISQHALTNNSVIIAKLKKGFYINTVEISDKFGAFVKLSLYLSEARKKIFKYRVGEIPMDEEISSLKMS